MPPASHLFGRRSLRARIAAWLRRNPTDDDPHQAVDHCGIVAVDPADFDPRVVAAARGGGDHVSERKRQGVPE